MTYGAGGSVVFWGDQLSPEDLPRISIHLKQTLAHAKITHELPSFEGSNLKAYNGLDCENQDIFLKNSAWPLAVVYPLAEIVGTRIRTHQNAPDFPILASSDGPNPQDGLEHSETKSIN